MITTKFLVYKMLNELCDLITACVAEYEKLLKYYRKNKLFCAKNKLDFAARSYYNWFIN